MTPVLRLYWPWTSAPLSGGAGDAALGTVLFAGVAAAAGGSGEDVCFLARAHAEERVDLVERRVRRAVQRRLV